MLAHVAHILDGAKIDRVRDKTELVPVKSKVVEEDVGGSVVGLTFLTDDAGDTGEHGEEAKRCSLSEGNVVEIPSALHLGSNRGMIIFNGHRGVKFVLRRCHLGPKIIQAAGLNLTLKTMAP